MLMCDTIVCTHCLASKMGGHELEEKQILGLCASFRDVLPTLE
ncbi:hypothetical protein AHF37_02845 [Paragonimus kellicotti]|nr:hypothetical protein AHF37_02845 [Paragonimus kellicotti]